MAAGNTLPQLSKEDYTIAWICALPETEMLASRYMLDQVHQSPAIGDSTVQYCFGSMSGHNVVMACLPVEQIGQSAAAAVLSALLQTFKIKFALMVGIAGGIWSEKNDVRLGDVVVSQPSKDQRHGGVIQYDYGKATTHGVQLMGSSNTPQMDVLTALSNVKSTPHGQGSFDLYLAQFNDYRNADHQPLFARPSTPDQLFESTYIHKGNASCDTCDKNAVREREPRHATKVHYGLIASGNMVVKDAALRDRISNLHGGVLAVDMEAAALVNQCSCLVIRGICDYCDSHKNKSWQPYAASVAAAWAKEFLRNVASASTGMGRMQWSLIVC